MNPAASVLLRPIESLYRAAVARRNHEFDAGRRVTRFDIPVIAVGNLSVGGVGKTPFCRMLAQRLIDRGRTPAIILRGYKARPGRPSDEEAEYRAAMPDLIVRANPDRTAQIASLLQEPSAPDVVILDDAFQHRFVHRDLDIVLLDATRSPFDDRCLPAGRLREPVESLHRANVVVLTRCAHVDGQSLDRLEGLVREVHASVTIVRSDHTWRRLRIHSDEADADAPLTSLDETKGVIAAAAIGNPRPFIRQLRSLADVRAELIRRDHHHWSDRDINRLRRLCESKRADAIVTTEKDWVKLRELDLSGLPPVMRPTVEFRLHQGEDALEAAITVALS